MSILYRENGFVFLLPFSAGDPLPHIPPRGSCMVVAVAVEGFPTSRYMSILIIDFVYGQMF